MIHVCALVVGHRVLFQVFVSLVKELKERHKRKLNDNLLELKNKQQGIQAGDIGKF